MIRGEQASLQEPRIPAIGLVERRESLGLATSGENGSGEDAAQAAKNHRKHEKDHASAGQTLQKPVRSLQLV